MDFNKIIERGIENYKNDKMICGSISCEDCSFHTTLNCKNTFRGIVRGLIERRIK